MEVTTDGFAPQLKWEARKQPEAKRTVCRRWGKPREREWPRVWGSREQASAEGLAFSPR